MLLQISRKDAVYRLSHLYPRIEQLQYASFILRAEPNYQVIDDFFQPTKNDWAYFGYLEIMTFGNKTMSIYDRTAKGLNIGLFTVTVGTFYPFRNNIPMVFTDIYPDTGGGIQEIRFEGFKFRYIK